VVTRSTDTASPGSNYQTVDDSKVPQGFSMVATVSFFPPDGAEKFIPAAGQTAVCPGCRARAASRQWNREARRRIGQVMEVTTTTLMNGVENLAAFKARFRTGGNRQRPVAPRADRSGGAVGDIF